MKRYWLVPDSHAAEVERLTGLSGRDTPLGVLVEQPPPPLDWNALRRALEPPPPCHCRGFMHQPNCPIGGGIT